MRKQVFTVALAVIGIFGFAQAKPLPFFTKLAKASSRAAVTHYKSDKLIGHKTESIFSSWNGASWDSNRREVYTYNSINLPSLTMIYELDTVGKQWMNTERTIYHYDAKGNQVSSLTQVNSGSAWVNLLYDTTYYDSHNNLVYSVNESWNDSAAVWEKTFGDSYIYTYNTGGVPTQIVGQSLDTAGNWYNTSRITLNLDSTGNINGGLIEQWNDSSSAWEPLLKLRNAKFKNNSIDMPLTYIMQVPVGSNWIDYMRYTATYDSKNRMVSDLTEMYLIATWVKQSRNIYHYDVNGNQTKTTYESWDNPSSSWTIQSGDSSIFTYDANNNAIVTESLYYSAFDSTWQKYQQERSKYVMVASGIAKAGNSSSFSVYPNPVADRVYLDLSGIAAGTKAAVMIVSPEGKTAFAGTFTASGTNIHQAIDVSGLAPGMYFMQVKAGDSVYTSKLIRE